MIVLAIVGLLAGMVVPRIFRYREPPAVRLQRTVEEASNLALSGVSIRLKLEPVESGGHGSVRRGRIAAEVLARAAAERHAQVGLDAREVVRPRAA